VKKNFSILVAGFVAFVPLFFYYNRLSDSSDPQSSITWGFVVVVSFLIFFVSLVSFFYILQIKSPFRWLFVLVFVGILGFQGYCLAGEACGFIK